MSRSVSWRRVCTEKLSARIDESLQSTLYLLNQTGPTGFIIKQDDKKFKVLLGDPHSCTCPQFKKERELCIHILWLMLKKFRISETNPIVFQLGLVEREIQEILNGHLKTQSPKQSEELATPNTSSCNQRPISPDDICPICQESLVAKPQRLSFCKYGCGNSVHLRCIKIWADHQKSQGELLINCPLCREKFSTFQELYEELHNTSGHVRRGTKAGRESLHLGVSCDHCHVCPIAGKCYKCDLCPSYFLCSNCFNSNHHNGHSFVFRQHPSHGWRSAIRSSLPTPAAEQSLIDELHSRELTENDYELLLGLDNPQGLMIGSPSTSARVPHYVLNSFHAEPLDNNNKLIRQGQYCRICSEPYQRGEWIRKLPCKHRFHRECIDKWLCNEPGHNTCPVDGQVVYDNSERHSKQTVASSRKKSTKSKCQPTIQQELGMSISGQGLLLQSSSSQEDEATGGSLQSDKSPFNMSVHRLRKGSVLSAPKHKRKMTSTIHKELSLQVAPVSASSSDSGEDVIGTPVRLANRTVSQLAVNTATRSNRVFRRGSLPVSLVAKRREEEGKESPNGRQNSSSLPKIQHQSYHVNKMDKKLSISTLSVGLQNSLPPINSHLRDRQ